MKLKHYLSSLFLLLTTLSILPLTAAVTDAQVESSLDVLKKDADAGDAYSARQLYMRYAASNELEQAKEWSSKYEEILKQKAKNGDSKAMLRLAASYLQGSDMFPLDLEQAQLWFASASAAGEPSAAYILAEIFKENEQAELAQEHYTRAYELYSEQVAKDPNNSDAIYWLGMMQLQAQGCELAMDAGIAQLELAASLNNRWAYVQLFKLFADGQLLPRDEQRAINYAETLATQFNDGLMAYATACAYLNGQGREQDEAKGNAFLEQACKGNIADAIMLKASRLEQSGKLAEAVPFYQQAASMAQEQAMTRLGTLLLKGEGLEKDAQQGVALLTTAAERFNSQLAPLELAYYYEREGEQSLADYWYVTASDRGVAQAMARRGLLHLNTNSDMDWNPTLAYRWWKAGSDAGDETCSRYINTFLYGFIPAVLILCFLGPVLLVRLLNKRAQARDAQQGDAPAH
ncbi:MAG: hypothetical protein R3Y56_11235 [Akkermansia sp.]